jgi:aspartyl-tRNA(Asn)/glutamyl-tRNA(Gln) amidotransferase subunit A
MTGDLGLASAAELARLYRAGKASPVEATRTALARIARLNDAYKAYVLVDEAGALKAARASERRWRERRPLGPLDGVSASVKDLILARGWPTRRGSTATDPDGPWTDDAPAVARLREAGAVLLGKTATPEFGWKWSTDSPLTGVTRNPWNAGRTPGGSSGGAAVAAALGMGVLHLGTDGGGSIRMPAAWTGIFGIKQTFGRVPAWPISPFGTLAHVGPMTRGVRDAALMLNCISGADWRDWYAPRKPGEDFARGLEAGVRGLRIAYSPTLGGAKVEPGVAQAVAEAARRFAALGARVAEAEPDLDPAAMLDCFIKHWFGTATVVVDGIAPEKRGRVDPGLLAIAETGRRWSAPDLIRAEIYRREIGFRLSRFFRRFDLLLTPSMPMPAIPVLTDALPAAGAASWCAGTPFSYPFNLSRNPAASVPCGLVEGLPVAFQLIAKHEDDALVLRACRAYEKAHPWKFPPVAEQ